MQERALVKNRLVLGQSHPKPLLHLPQFLRQSLTFPRNLFIWNMLFILFIGDFMVSRRGYGKNQGQGYKNLLPPDSTTHSMSARGIKSTKDEPLIQMQKINNPYDFGKIPTTEKQGLIKELARKAHQGFDWAVAWEKRHLPGQKEWVKKEYKKAKELAHKAGDKIHDFQERIKKDRDDVRDELDTNDDGVQDIHIDKLKDVNKGIKRDLSKIDLDKDGQPDAHQSGFFGIEPKGRKPLPEPPKSPRQELFEKAEFEIKPKKPSFVRRFVEGSKHKLGEMKTERDFIRSMGDTELKEKAVREESGFFGGANKFQKELIRRQKSRINIRLSVAQAKKEEEKKFKERQEKGGLIDQLIGSVK